jgi:hypothetical protein
MPFFSVVIPTRNRPELVQSAIASVLAQDFDDYEVVVSDNSDDALAEPTRAHVLEALDHPRVRYVRPPKVLPMSDHWEWAVQQTRGEFTGVLTDRMAFKHYTLRTVHGALLAEKLDLISFLSDRLLGDEPPFRLRLGSSGGAATVMRSEDVLADCARAKLSKRLPRMLNSFCRTERILALIPEYGSVFTSISPDYAFCFRILDQLDSFISLDHRLLVVGGEAQSNGRCFKTGRMNAHSRDFIRLYHGLEQWFRNAPIPCFTPIPENTVLLEYEVARINQRSGRFRAIDEAGFYRQAYRGLQESISQGHDLGDAAAKLEQFRRDHGLPRATAADGPGAWRLKRIERMLKEPVQRALDRVMGPALCFLTDHVNISVRGRPVKAVRYRNFESFDEALRFEARYFRPSACA